MAQTGELQEVTLLELANGAIMEQLTHETGKLLQNIIDPNTDPKVKRKMTITLGFAPSADRTGATVEVKCETKLAGIKPVQTILNIGGTVDAPVAVEYNRQVAGQLDMAGNEENTPKLIKVERGA